MTFRNTLVVAAILTLGAAPFAMAQSTNPVAVPDTTSATRADVKSETRAANKEGDIPRGQETRVTQGKGGASDSGGPTTTRSDRKATARAANVTGSIPRGEESKVNQGKGMGASVDSGSTTTRADRKASARAANKSGSIPRGQESTTAPDTNKGTAP